MKKEKTTNNTNTRLRLIINKTKFIKFCVLC